MLDREYPNSVDQLTDDDLLNWPLWSVCITIYSEFQFLQLTCSSHNNYCLLGSEMMIQLTDGRSCLPVESSKMCGLADSRVIAFMQRIMDGEVTLKEMENVKEKRSTVEKLCLANQDYDVEKIKTALERREKEYNALKWQKKVLASFCHEMDTAKIKIDGIL